MLVKEIMQYGATTIAPDESVDRVMKLMTHHRIRHVPELRGGKLVAIVSIGDIVKHRLEIWSLRRTCYVMFTTPRVDGLGEKARGCPHMAHLGQHDRAAGMGIIACHR